MTISSFARASLAVLAVSTSTLAMAQDTQPVTEVAATDGDIVVTAQRREQSLLVA